MLTKYTITQVEFNSDGTADVTVLKENSDTGIKDTKVWRCKQDDVKNTSKATAWLQKQADDDKSKDKKDVVGVNVEV